MDKLLKSCVDRKWFGKYKMMKRSKEYSICILLGIICVFLVDSWCNVNKTATDNLVEVYDGNGRKILIQIENNKKQTFYFDFVKEEVSSSVQQVTKSQSESQSPIIAAYDVTENANTKIYENGWKKIFSSQEKSPISEKVSHEAPSKAVSIDTTRPSIIDSNDQNSGYRSSPTYEEYLISKSSTVTEMEKMDEPNEEDLSTIHYLEYWKKYPKTGEVDKNGKKKSPWIDRMYRKRRIPKAKPKINCLSQTEPIDLVVTWVNGSDPTFKDQVDFQRSKYTGSKIGTETNRFYDMGQLKYLLRSVEKYSPWIRYVFLLTNGQIPIWMNTFYEKLKIVTHDQIFIEKDHLPSFSSPAIEINMHRIPGLSKRFLYANDDYFFMESVCPQDFIKDQKLVLYIKDKKHITPYGHQKKFRWNCKCPPLKYQNGICDDECNKFECFWDGHDCDYQRPKSNYYFDSRPAYHQSVDYTQLVLDRKYHKKGEGVNNRTWNAHLPMMFDKDIISDIWTDFPLETNLTSSHRVRLKTDLQFEMMFIYYSLESPRNYNVTTMNEEPVVGYYGIENKYKENALTLQNCRKALKKFNCINDNLKHDGSIDSLATYRFVEQFYTEYFPTKSKFEL